MADENVKPLTAANDSWQQAVMFFTGYKAPARDTLFKSLEGNEGIPQMKVEISKQNSVTYVDVDDLNWMVENSGWRIENTDFVIPFYATSDDTASTGDQISMYKARFTLLGNKSNDGPPEGGVVEGGEFKSQYDNHLGLSGDKATWSTEDLTQYSYGTGRALEALLYKDQGTHGFAWNGVDVPNDQAVSLGSFDTAAASFDRVAQFFAARSKAVEEWESRLGTEQNEAWRGQAAGVFWNLVHTIGKQYAGYEKDMRPADTTGSLQGDEIRQAKTDFRNAVVELHRRWMDWELYMGNPLRWLHDLLKEIADHVWHNNIKKITYKVNSTGGQYASYYTTYHTTDTFNQDATRLGKADNFGNLTELSTWKKVGERAIENWQASVIENLVSPADEAIRQVHNSWSTKNFDLGSIRTRGGDDLSSQYAEDQAAKDKADAEAAAAAAAKKQEEFMQWQKDQAAAAAAAAAAAKAEQDAKEKAAKAEQDAKEKAAKAEQDAKEKAAKEEQARRDAEAAAKQAEAEAKQEAKEAEQEAKQEEKEKEQEAKQAEQEAKQEEKEKEQEAKQAEQEAKQEAKEAEQKAEQERLQAEQEAKQAEQEKKQEEAQGRQEQMQLLQMNQAKSEQERARKEQQEQQAEQEAKQEAKEAEQEAKQAEQEAKQEAKQAEQEAKQEEKEKEQEAKQAEQEAKQAEKEKEAEAAQDAARKEAEQQQAEQEQRQQAQEKEREEAQAQAQAAYDEQRQQVLGGGSLDGGSLNGGSLDGGTLNGGDLDGSSAAREALGRISADAGAVGGGSLNGGSLNGGPLNGGSLNGGSLDGSLGGDDLTSPTSISGPVYQGDGLPGPDGAVTHMDSDGRVVTEHPDGSRTTIDPQNHTATITRPDGTSMTGPLNTGDTLPNPDGSLSHLDSEGRLVTEFPDGSSSVLDPGTGATSYTLPDGTTTSGYLNGGTGSPLSGYDGASYGSGSPYEEELYDELPYASPFDRAAAASASTPMIGTPLNTGSLPGSSLPGSSTSGAGQTGGTPMGGMPMGGMPMGGQGGGQGGQGTSERIRNVIDGGQVVSNRRNRGGAGLSAASRAPDEAPIALPRNATTTSGMPMVPPPGGGAPARPQTESGDRARDAWIQEEEDVWGTDEGGAPAVIGR
ncbi:AAWKG family protein [Streptomyces sp. NPDC091271]|uniref:AAWKG family protein n=1 Tax=Streptomyces sp. NPDC091271 TaxID=3365980 RepID=UPI0037FBEA69